MKLWLDILTPKQLLFAEPFIKPLEKEHTVLVTTRKYRELDGLVKLKQFNCISLGRFGTDKLDKLQVSTNRINLLTQRITKYKPDVTISFLSPDASRVSFGLGIPHIGFTDSPHAEATMKLSIPLLNILYTPLAIPKSLYMKFGISDKNIRQYPAIDGALIAMKHPFKPRRNHKNILLRMPENEASYKVFKDAKVLHIIDQILEHFPHYSLHVLPRNETQIDLLRPYRSKLNVITHVQENHTLLSNADIFIGSGGTMTTEAIFSGIPTISYDDRPDHFIDWWLAQNRFSIRESNPKNIPITIDGLLQVYPEMLPIIKDARKYFQSPLTDLKKLLRTYQRYGRFT